MEALKQRCMGLLVCAMACLAGGCATMSLEPAGDGIHPAQPFGKPPAHLDDAGRVALYEQYRATLNAVGYQVGLVPLSESLFAQHLALSGAPDLAKNLRTAANESMTLGLASGVAGISSGFFNNPAARLGASAFSWLAGGASDAIRTQGVESAAEQYNERLCKALGLPLTYAGIRKGLPGPLAREQVDIDANRGFDDWVWDRSFHIASPMDHHLLVGGQPVAPAQIANYLESQGAQTEAEQYRSGQSLSSAGGWVEAGGLAAMVLGVVGLVESAEHPGSGGWGAPLFVAGVVAQPVALVLSVEGGQRSNEAVDHYNVELPMRLHLHVRLFKPPVAAPNGSEPGFKGASQTGPGTTIPKLPYEP